MSPREHFAAIGLAIAEEEEELHREAARRAPGEKIVSSLRWSRVWLRAYERKLADPSFSKLEDERAWHKADLHAIWRARRPRER